MNHELHIFCSANGDDPKRRNIAVSIRIPPSYHCSARFCMTQINETVRNRDSAVNLIGMKTLWAV